MMSHLAPLTSSGFKGAAGRGIDIPSTERYSKTAPSGGLFLFYGVSMIKSKRFGLDKSHSARKFRHDVGRTHSKNMRLQPMRGGWRL